MDKGDILPLTNMLIGLSLILEQSTITASMGCFSGVASINPTVGPICGITWGVVGEGIGVFLIAFGPIVEGVFLEIVANRSLAWSVSIEPWMNGKRTVYVEGVERTFRLPSLEGSEGVPRFRSVVKVTNRSFRHPKLGPQGFIHVEHNFGLGYRLRYRKGKGMFAGQSVNLNHIDGNVVLSEHPTFEKDLDYGTHPVYDLMRAGGDWAIMNGDTALEELQNVELEHEKPATFPKEMQAT